MVGSISATSSITNMISMSYQQNNSSTQSAQTPPPPPSGAKMEDPLGVFDSVDSDTDGTVSESEFETLAQGILEITGSEQSSSFGDFDTDGDGVLNAAELRSVMDEAGFEPPPPPPQEVVSAYESQQDIFSASDPLDDSLSQLLEYLDVTA